MAGVIDAKPKNLIPKSWVTQAAKSPTAPVLNVADQPAHQAADETAQKYGK